MASRTFTIKRVQGAPVTDGELLDDLRHVAKQFGQGMVGQKEYRRVGTYDDSTVTRRFGSWNPALLKAGLVIANTMEVAASASSSCRSPP